jgi:uncharacterized BrkB/YihY/UPF0761 family membrane protein
MTSTEPRRGKHPGGDARFAKTKQRIDATKERAVALRDQLEKVPAGAETLDAIDHDQRIGGNLLAGALAYRVFVFLLPVALVAVSLLGFLRSARSGAPADYAQDLGVSAYVTSTVAEAAEHGQRGRWIALAVGLVALASTSRAVAKALRAIHALAWAVPMGRMRSAPKAMGAVVGVTTAIVLITDVTREARQVGFGFGLVITVVAVGAYAALMMAVALVLPHRNARWYELLPGVVLVAVGAVGMQILTSYYIVPRLQSASDTYGALGGATVVLIWLYLLSRLIVASAVVNANHWARRHRVDLDAERPGLVTRQL